MFLFTEVKYHLLRGKGRSLLMVCIAALLLGAMGFYLSNIQTNQAALENLAEKIPVAVQIVTRDGKKSSNLNIDKEHVDLLRSGGVKEESYIVELAGALTEEARAQEPFLGGDTAITGANCLEALRLAESDLTLADGWDSSFLSGSDAVCVLGEYYAESHGIKPGDTLFLPVYTVVRTGQGQEYEKLADCEFQVIGLCKGSLSVLAPADFLRAQADRLDKSFYYSSFRCMVADAVGLDSFKHEMADGPTFFFDIYDSDDFFTGDALSVEDELFIKTSVKLRENIRVFRAFLIPFFGLVVLLAFLSTFLLLRGSRRDMALARSLGRPKAVSGFTHFLAVLAADLIGALLALPVMLWGVGLSPSQAAMIVGLFLLCAAVGAALALVLLLRFRALALLTKVD